MGCNCWPKRSSRKRSRFRKFWRRKKKVENASEVAAIPDQGTLPVQAQEPLVPEPLAQEPLAQEPPVQEPPVQEPLAQEPPVQEPPVQEAAQSQDIVPEAKPNDRMDVAVHVRFVYLL